MKVKVVAHLGKLVMVPIRPLEGIGQGWYPTGTMTGGCTRIGCVVLDTARRLGVSEEALKLMRGIRRGPDALGDLSWWLNNDATHAFSWFGPIYRVIDPMTAEATCGFRADDHSRRYCTIIPNEVPELAQQALLKDPECHWWGEPRRVHH